MVDLDTHRIIDMIPTRETGNVILWLKKFPNIELVSRDGSTSYANAIRSAHPGANQISDKFHIVKNLTDRATQYFHKIFKGRITIPATSKAVSQNEIIRNGTREEKIYIVKQMRREGKSMAEIHATTGIRQPTVEKYCKLPDDQITEKRKTVREKEHEDAVKKAMAKAKWVRELSESGLSKYAIAKETGFTYRTIAEYLRADFNPVSAHYGKLREGKLAPFRDTVLKMRKEGVTYQKIADHIRGLGYDGSVSALRGFITKERRISADLTESIGDSATELIERKYMIRLLYKPLTEVKGITFEQYDAVVKKYPQAAVVYRVIKMFRRAINSKKTKRLLIWINAVRALDVPEFNAFINGLEQDLDAVKNTVVYDYNNGLAEGSVNKLKVIKRIMYGKCSFELLRNKVIAWEKWKHIN
jgi:predicted transcriptional regulator